MYAHHAAHPENLSTDTSSTDNMESLHSALCRIFDKNQILDNRLWREVYSRDASYFNIMPQAVVRPTDVRQVQQLMALCRSRGIGVTFRSGGTSLAGQAVNNGIICELRTTMHGYEVRDGGKRVWFEPGLTCLQVNTYLKPYGTHIGPDPGSQDSAMMGGILANNSSGMSAGIRYNSYHTLAGIEFILANGHRYNSALDADRDRFEANERDLCRGLMDIRRRILASPEMTEKIRRKYSIKNVTGYGMNAFTDFDNPMDIFAHVLIGSEGTLAYIVSGELNTIPTDAVYSSAMLYFPTVTSAASHAAWLGESGALRVEMMDYASLKSYLGERMDMPRGTTAMLIDYGASASEEMEAKVSALLPRIKALKGLSRLDPFTTTVAAREKLWRMRNGIFPCVAGARVPGSTVILEDVAAPVADLDRLVNGVEKLFDKYGYHGSIFGHARDGNIHPLLTSPVDSEKEITRFRHFMDDFVNHVLSLDGSLKGEHGTGRAIAPFVAREWGEDIYALMKELKHLADPQNVLNPDVLINDDPDCFIKPMKEMTLFGQELGVPIADKCIECGACEHVCPTRDITMTPRQRIQALRVMARMPDDKELRRQYRWPGPESCCSDGLCQVPCPVHISTSDITDAIRERTNPRFFDSALTASARHFGGVEKGIRGLLRTAVATQKVISPYPLIWASDFAHRIYRQVPHWSKFFPMPARLHFTETANPDYLYFPACVTRIFGGSTLGKDDLITVVQRIAARAGITVAVPKEMHSLCCSQIWEHKGDREGQAITANRTVEAFYRLSDSGRIPIFCDTTSCTHVMLTHMRDALTDENRRRYDALHIMDITVWLDRVILPRAHKVNRKGTVILHPTCAARILGLSDTFVRIAQTCAERVVVPDDAQCCGAAGDRGFLFPEVARSACAPERIQLDKLDHIDGAYSLARTCEISMQTTLGRPYESVVYLVDETVEM